MTPHEALCHSSDAFRMALGERAVAPVRVRFKPVIRFVALWTPLPWPKGRLQTVPEAEAGVGGTPPVTFEEDRAELLALMARFAAAPAGQLLAVHPILGRMRREDWGRWGYRHMDHHLRQFGA